MARALITRAETPLLGTPNLPGDKSLSHRRALLSLFVDDEVELCGFNLGHDCRTTLACLQALGKTIERCKDRVVIRGPAGCRNADLDCGNSGTTARLLMGILAAHEGRWTLKGDSSLSCRPMERVADPLRRMGARIELSDGHLPAVVGGRELRAIEYDSPVPSAQVKSAVLMAGLRADGITRYREPVPTRDHTERLLGAKSATDGWITLDPQRAAITAESLSAEIPGDPSAAALWLAAGILIPGSQIRLPGVLVNPRRTAYLDLLARAGAEVAIGDVCLQSGESVGALSAKHSATRAFLLQQPATALLMDEVPILAVIASRSEGRSEFGDASELRIKESDRLRGMCEGLRRMGARVEPHEDGFSVDGPAELHGAVIESLGDHRLAMAFAVAGLIADGRTVINDAECASVSDPGFWSDLERLCPGCVTLEQ